jgi:hypothetical protein
MTLPHLAGWVPIRVYKQQAQLLVDWCYLGSVRFTDPFFDQTIQHVLRHPFNLLFRHQTPIDALGEWHARQPGLPPTGFIFHMSRCGSTLVSQMLAALPENLVLSEAGPIESVLHADSQVNVTDNQRLAWLRWMVSALGQPREGNERYCFIKFESWHILDLPFIRRAFPDVPWIFVYREPVEVMVSNLRHSAGRMLAPGPLEARLLDVDLVAVRHMPREEYLARALGRFCDSALRHHANGGMLLNYRQLPDIVWSVLLHYFGTAYAPTAIERLREVPKWDAKNPGVAFADDAAAKRCEASAQVLQTAERWVIPFYERLEAARRGTRDKPT